MQQGREGGGVFLHAPVGGKYMACLSVRLPVTEGGSLLWTARTDADGGSQATNARYFTCLLRLLSKRQELLFDQEVAQFRKSTSFFLTLFLAKEVRTGGHFFTVWLGRGSNPPRHFGCSILHLTSGSPHSTEQSWGSSKSKCVQSTFLKYTFSVWRIIDQCQFARQQLET